MGEPGADVVSSSKAGWKTIEYHGIRVDIPVDWERSDMDGCEFDFEHWGPPDSPDCGSDGGVAFYSSATFDPAHGPGVRHAETHGDETATWDGWVSGGEFAVYASDADRKLVEEVLNSVRND